MSIADSFFSFCDDIKVKNKEDISTKYTAITACLNKAYWNTDAEYTHCLQVGSYGRKTGIAGISDLDMVFELPLSVQERFDSYAGNGQSALLQDVKAILCAKYPTTTGIKGDGQVVVINFKSLRVEVLPCFRQADDSYLHPDTHDGGTWEYTNPRPEIAAVIELDKVSNGCYRDLCRMTRAWKNNVGLNIGGWLIDTLCYRLITSNEKYNSYGFEDYGRLCLDLFCFMSNLDESQEYWMSPGSNQRVYKKANFIPKAKKAFNKASEAIAADSAESATKMWSDIFGKKFPLIEMMKKAYESASTYSDTENFIENMFDVDIQNSVQIECEVTQDGFRPTILSKMPFLSPSKKLRFYIHEIDVTEPFELYWKVRNIGPTAERKNMIRGQIVKDKGFNVLRESSDFQGPHFVECYVIKDGICVARDRIGVSIKE
jgi:hypothetical protein